MAKGILIFLDLKVSQISELYFIEIILGEVFILKLSQIFLANFNI